MTDYEEGLLDFAESVFVEFVQPNAALIDREPMELGRALGTLASNGLLSLRRPDEYGGPGVGEQAFRAFQELSARYSGALSFLMTQHQSAVSMIAKSENVPLKERILPLVGETAQSLIGIGISQLRRPGPPAMRATPVEGGYRIDGDVPWITGFGFFDRFTVGATLPDGAALFGLLPFTPRFGSSAPETLEKALRAAPFAWELNGGAILIEEPMKLAVFEAANTVVAHVDNWFLPSEDVVFIKPPEWPVLNDMINIVLQGHFALGCAQAGIDCMRMGYARKPAPFVLEAIESLEAQLAECREAASAIPGDLDSETTETKLKVRAWAIELAVKCAHAGVVVCGGAANGLDHPAQRVYREALVYSVSAQTTDIMRATLERLST